MNVNYDLLLHTASVSALLAALDGLNDELRRDLLDDGLRYACPTCQLGRRDWHFATRVPAVTVLNDVTAGCDDCRDVLTIFKLRRLVAEDAHSLVRLAEATDAEETVI